MASRARQKTPASDAVRSEWLRRIEAEYRSAAITQELVLWLIRIAASPDLIDDGLRIVKDELVHAEQSHIVYTAADGTEPPRIDRDTLGLRRRASDPLEFDVLRAAVDVFCLGETVAVRLFKELRDPCTVPPAKRALDRILRDEVRHRDFGWALLEWLLESPSGATLRSLLVSELPRMFERIRRSYAPASALGRTEMAGADRAWGLMPPARYPALVTKTYERDYTPRFARLGIDAQNAWDPSYRGTGA